MVAIIVVIVIVTVGQVNCSWILLPNILYEVLEQAIEMIQSREEKWWHHRSKHALAYWLWHRVRMNNDHRRHFFLLSKEQMEFHRSLALTLLNYLHKSIFSLIIWPLPFSARETHCQASITSARWQVQCAYLFSFNSRPMMMIFPTVTDMCWWQGLRFKDVHWYRLPQIARVLLVSDRHRKNVSFDPLICSIRSNRWIGDILSRHVKAKPTDERASPWARRMW